MVFGYTLCAGFVTFSLGQAAWRWNGARSALSLAIGMIAGAAVALAARQGRQSGFALGNALGVLAVIPTVIFFAVPNPGPVLGVSQALADGYIAAQFATLTFFIKRPEQKAPRV